MNRSTCGLDTCRRPLPAGRKKWCSDAHAKIHRRREHNRKYGWPHRRKRKWWKARVDRGNVRCALCPDLIDPNEPWELDHDENGGYRGPVHPWCNRADGAGFYGRGEPTPEETRRMIERAISRW